MRKLHASKTSLAESGLLDDWHVAKLKALGVTSVEGLFGLIQSDPSATSKFLEVSNLAVLQNEAIGKAEPQLMAALDLFAEPSFALGALPPEGVEVEEVASLETFEAYMAQYPPGHAATDTGGVDLRDCFGPVRDQGDRGTCVAQTGIAMMECLLGRRGPSVDLSEQWLYWLCKERDGTPNQEGTQIDIAMAAATADGACLEEIWTYDPIPIPGNEGQGPPPAGAAAEAAGRTLDDWEELAFRSTDAITGALDGSLPVAIGVPVYDNWYSNPDANAFGEIPLPLPLSRFKGGHAMCVVGYDFDDQVPGGAGLVVRNSWGTDWAPQSPIEPGYGVLPFPYVEQYGWGAYVLR